MVINNMKQLPDPGLDYWANKSHEAAIPYIFLAGDPKQIACTYIYRLPYVEKLIATKAVREWSDALQERSGSHSGSESPNGMFVRAGAMPVIEEWMKSAPDYEVTVVRKMMSHVTHESRKRRESERQPEGSAGSLFQSDRIIGTRTARTSRPQTGASLSCEDVEQPGQIIEECSGEQETFRSVTTEETEFADEYPEPTPRQATPTTTPLQRVTSTRGTPVRATSVTIMSPDLVVNQQQPTTPPLSTKEFEQQYVATPASAQRQTSAAHNKSDVLLGKRSKQLPRSTSLDNSKPHLANRPPSSRVVPSQGAYSINYENLSGMFHRVAPKGSNRLPDSFMTWASDRDNFAIKNYETDSLDGGDRRQMSSHRVKQKTSSVDDLNRLINRKRGGEQRNCSGTQHPTSRAGQQKPKPNGNHRQITASSIKSVTPHARFEPTPPRSPSLTDVHHPSNGEVEVTKYRNKKVITIEQPRKTTADAVRSRQRPVVNVDMSYAL